MQTAIIRTCRAWDCSKWLFLSPKSQTLNPHVDVSGIANFVPRLLSIHHHFMHGVKRLALRVFNPYEQLHAIPVSISFPVFSM